MSIRSFGKDSLVYGAGGASLRLVSLLLLPILTAYLGPVEYGVVAMLATMAAVVQPVFTLGCGVSMGPVYFEAESTKQRSTVVWSTVALHLSATLFLLLTAAGASSELGGILRVGEGRAQVIQLALVNCAVAILASDLLQWLQFERLLLRFLVASVGGALVGGLVSIVGVTTLNLGVAGVLWGQVATNVIVLAITVWTLMDFGRGTVSLAVCVRLLKGGIPMIPSFAFLFILTQSNRYILEASSGLAAVGVYSIGFGLGTAISIVVSAVVTAWYPFFMAYMNTPASGEVVFGKIMSYYVLLLGFLCLAISLFADTIVSLVAHGDFREASAVVGVVAFSQAVQGMFNLMLPGIYFRKEVHYVAVIQGSAALVSLPLNYLLIRFWGSVGAGIGVLVSSILLVVLTFLWNRMRAAVYPRIRYEWRKLGGALLIVVSVYAVYLGLHEVALIPPLALSIGLTIAALLLMLCQLDADERYAVRKWIGLP
jgi:O-antigen/teichoic acid export membrane protein